MDVERVGRGLPRDSGAAVSRSGYTDEWNEDAWRWRGVVASAARGKRGQVFFRDLVAALDAMPVKRLEAGELETNDGDVCALGALGKAKGVDVTAIDTEDYATLGKTFDIAEQLAQETMYMNDECGPETPEQRWARVRKWAAEQIRVRPYELQPETP